MCFCHSWCFFTFHLQEKCQPMLTFLLSHWVTVPPAGAAGGQIMMTNRSATTQSRISASSVKWDRNRACLPDLFGGGREEAIQIKNNLADAQ